MVIKRTETITRSNWRTNEKTTEYEIYYYYVKEINENILMIVEYQRYPAEEMNKMLEKAIRTGNLLKPKNMELINNCEKSELQKRLMRFGRSNERDNLFEYIKKTPEEIGLLQPTFYENNEPVQVLEIDPDIDEDLFNRIKNCLTVYNEGPVICGEDPYHIKDKVEWNGEYIDDTEWLKFYCPFCNKVFFRNGGNKCPECGKIIHNTIVDADFRRHRKDIFHDKYASAKADLSCYSSTKNSRMYYMEAFYNGVVLYKIAREISMKKGVYKDRYAIEGSIVHKVGEEIAAYKHLKKGKKACDPLDVLNINTATISNPPKIIYEGADSFFQFAKQNEKAMRMMGFVDVMKYSKVSLKLEPFFILFLSIMNKYPVMEQLIKSGYSNLFFGLYDKIRNSTNKDEMVQYISLIEQLVNKDATSGKKALRFPEFIGDYLVKKNADIEEYCYWRDIYELTHPSKEQFEKITSSFDFAYINADIGLCDICNILKYGYKTEQLFSYIIKTYKKESRDMRWVVQTLADYLMMCELSGITPDLFPMHLSKQHDAMALHFNRGTTEDIKILKVAIDCEKYLPSEIEDDSGNRKIGVPKLLNDYVVIFPKSENDFIQEGNMQHNCVGSYPRRVKDGYSVIFFIREKSNPEKSFITGECTKKGLGQFYLSNNRHVENSEMIALGKYVANKILSGVSSGAIRALGNIDK